MKERYALVKFRPFSKLLYTYSCKKDVKKGNVVLVNTAGTNRLQEALVAKIRYLHPWELPVEKECIKPIIAIKHVSVDNTMFCEKLDIRYAFTSDINVEKKWMVDDFFYDGEVEGFSFSVRYRYIKKNCVAYIDVFSKKIMDFLK